jgi:hypothetical protein
VISNHHGNRRFESQKTLPKLSQDSFHEKILQNESSRDKDVFQDQALQQGEPFLVKVPDDTDAVSSYDQATIFRTMKLPTLKEAPSILKTCYQEGVLSRAAMLKTDVRILENIKTATYRSGDDHKPTFWHRLSFKFGKFPEVNVFGEGQTKVWFLPGLVCLMLISMTEKRPRSRLLAPHCATV